MWSIIPAAGIGSRIQPLALELLLVRRSPFFPVARPELFDVVVTDEGGRVLEVQVKRSDLAEGGRAWGARAGQAYVGTRTATFIHKGGFLNRVSLEMADREASLNP